MQPVYGITLSSITIVSNCASFHHKSYIPNSMSSTHEQYYSTTVPQTLAAFHRAQLPNGLVLDTCSPGFTSTVIA